MTTQPRRLAWLAVAGLGLVGVAIALTLTSGHERHRTLTAVIGALVALSFIAGGIVAWWRRPGNRTGPLMAGVGFAFILSGLQEANESWLYTVGTVLGAMYLAVFVHLLLAYPDGRLHGRPERILVPAAYALAFLAELVREKALELTRDELPHAISVEVEEMVETSVRAIIYVETDSQKMIVVGRGGSMVREIGTRARPEIEAVLGRRVYLELRVKARPRWRRDEAMLERLGI